MQKLDPQNNYTDAEVKAALAGVDGTRELTVRYQQLDSNNNVTGDIDYIIDGKVTNNSLADIKRTATFTAVDMGNINYLKDRVKPYVRIKMPADKVYADVVKALQPVNWYKLDDAKQAQGAAPTVSTGPATAASQSMASAPSLSGLALGQKLFMNQSPTAYTLFNSSVGFFTTSADFGSTTSTASAELANWTVAGGATKTSGATFTNVGYGGFVLPLNGTASRTITGLTVGTSYRIFTTINNLGVFGSMPVTGSSPAVSIGINGIGASDTRNSFQFPDGNAMTRDAAFGYQFTATATSHTLVFKGLAVNAGTINVNRVIVQTGQIGNTYNPYAWVTYSPTTSELGRIAVGTITEVWYSSVPQDAANAVQIASLSGTQTTYSFAYLKPGTYYFKVVPKFSSIPAGNWNYGEVLIGPSAVLLDSSGNNNHATINNYNLFNDYGTTATTPNPDLGFTPIVNDRGNSIGPVVSSSGSTPIINLTNSSTVVTQLTYNAWTRVESGSVGGYQAFDNFNGPNSVALTTAMNTAGTVRNWFIDEVIINGVTVQADSAPNVDTGVPFKSATQYMITTVIDNALGRVFVSINGSRVWSGVYTPAAGMLLPAPFFYSGLGSPQSYDDVSYYPNLVGATDIQALYNAGVGPAPRPGYVEWPQGVFLLSTPGRKYSTAGVVTRDIAAYDQLQVLSDDAISTRLSFAVGSKYTDNMAAVLAGQTFKWNIVPSASTLVAALEWAPGTTKLKVLNDLAAAVNYDSCTFDENGVLILKPYQSPANKPATFNYATDSTSVITGDVNQTLDLFDVPNKWVMVYSDADAPPLVGTYTNSNPLSPTSTVSRGRTILSYTSVSDVSTVAVLNGLAAKAASDASQVYETVTYTTAIMPMHGNADVFTIKIDGLAIDDKYGETQWEMPLGSTGTMTHSVRKIVAV